MRIIAASLMLVCSAWLASAQETPVVGNLNEQRVPLNQPAVALDGTGAPALEATLRTTALNGAPETPVTNIHMVIKNRSTLPYAFVSGAITFYDAAGVRCGEGLFKADALGVDEAFETDTPGIRIRCSPSTWRIVANNLLARVGASGPVSSAPVMRGTNLVITVDGEEHPIQLDKPMVVKFGDVERTIILREAPRP